MKKLKNKVFWTIFIILTSSLVSIISIFNYQDYKKEENNIENNLTRLQNNIDKDINHSMIPNENPRVHTKEDEIKDEFSKKIFMDAIVYTVLLDKNNDIVEIISHNEEPSNDETIKEVASRILKSKDLKEIKIGNLYLANYSYFFQEKSFLTIIDNQLTKKKLLSSLKNSILLLILLDIIIIYFSKKITSWMIRPVVESFSKQKQFIADASHELKTPISIIMASADALEEDKMEEKWLHNIKSEADRMNNLVSDLLDLAKLEQEDNQKIYSIHNLSKITEMQVLTFESLAFEEHLSLKYEIEKEISLNCDSNQIKQLISILLDNAIKHSDEKEKIKVNLYKEKGEIILTVTNKGSPIPEEEQEKIFERFYRLDKSRNRNENRYGLGLAIAKNIVINHNGKISVSSNNGYTTFKVVFK